MIGNSEDAVQENLRDMEAAERVCGVSMMESDEQHLRPPPAAHPIQNSYCRQAESVSDYARQHNSPPRASRDSEKASSFHQPMPIHQHCAHRTTSAHTDEDEGEYDDEDNNPKTRAVWILVSCLDYRVNLQVLNARTDIPLRTRTPPRPSHGYLHTFYHNPPPIAIPILPAAKSTANQHTVLPLPCASTPISTWPHLLILRDRVHNKPYWSQHSHLGFGEYVCTILRSGNSIFCMGRRGVLVLHGYTGQPRWKGREG